MIGVAKIVRMEVCDIVQETRIKTIPMGKKCKKAKWLSGEALQIAARGSSQPRDQICGSCFAG